MRKDTTITIGLKEFNLRDLIWVKQWDENTLEVKVNNVETIKVSRRELKRIKQRLESLQQNPSQ